MQGRENIYDPYSTFGTAIKHYAQRYGADYAGDRQYAANFEKQFEIFI